MTIDPRPSRWLHHSLNWSILGNPDELRRLYVEQRLDKEQIAERAGCHPSTVQRWLSVYGIKRPRRINGKPQRMGREQLHALIREVAARVAFQRFGVCRDDCPHGGECDKAGCPFEVQPDATADPWWDG